MKIMNKINLRYKNIFLHSSLQSIGNTLEYFISHTEKLVVFIVMQRVKNKGNFVRLYICGKLVKEESFILPENIFLYYLGWYIQYVKVLNKYYTKKERVFIIIFHPIFFFGMSIQKIMRNVEFVYWIMDYFPGMNLILKIYEKLKKFYHDRIIYSCYLSDAINRIMNGKILNSDNRKTVMWGVRSKGINRTFDGENFNILFVGLITESQGLEFFYEFLKLNRQYNIKIIGVCENKLYQRYKAIIKDYKIQKQVYFPNKFFSDQKLNEISKECQVGIALYNIDKYNVTYYTDPGKVKTYTELGLPVIMSNTSSIVPYILKFKAGEVVERNFGSIKATIIKVRKNYNDYLDGVAKFNKYFYFEDYYKEKFKFLENLTKNDCF